MPKLIFRTDGNALIGLGHLVRSSALADMVETYFQIQFVINKDAPESISTNLAKNYTIISVRDEADFLGMIAEGDGVVLDGYNFSSDLQKRIKEKKVNLIVIDDVHDKHFYSDIIINQALGVSPRDYAAEPYTRFLFGPKHCIVRKPFLKKDEYRTQQRLSTIFICFGGSDFPNITLFLLKELTDQPRWKFNVVVGAAYQHLKELKDFANSCRREIYIYQDVEPEILSRVIDSSDVAIVPASSILLEALSLGVPSLSGFYADNQVDIYKGYLQERLLAGVGDFRNIKEASLAIKNILSTEIDIDQEKLSYYFDGNSPKRFIKEFVRLFLSSDLTLHLANIDDSNLLFEWANDFETRSNAINTSSISWEEHSKWFDSKLNSPDTLMFIAKFNDIPVGQIRFDKNESFIDLTYSVSRIHRGIGFGNAIIIKGIQNVKTTFLSKKIRAFVVENNAPSIKIFRKMNFTESETVNINGRKFYQFQYSLN